MRDRDGGVLDRDAKVGLDILAELPDDPREDADIFAGGEAVFFFRTSRAILLDQSIYSSPSPLYGGLGVVSAVTVLEATIEGESLIRRVLRGFQRQHRHYVVCIAIREPGEILAFPGRGPSITTAAAP